MKTDSMTSGNLALAHHQMGSGPDWVFQHGLCGDAGQPMAVAPAHRTTHVLEMRGHGQSPLGPAEDIAIATFADDLSRLMEERGLGPCPVGGISMGAAIALRLAVHHPALVSALVLARPAWVCDAGPANLAPNAEVGAALASTDPHAARKRFQRGRTAAMLRHVAPDNLMSLNGFFDRNPVAETATLLSRISADGPGISRTDLVALALPTLVIGTEDDHIHPMGYVDELAALIPGAQRVTLPSKSSDPVGYATAFRSALTHFLKDK